MVGELSCPTALCRRADAPYPPPPVKLAIVLADATTRDAQGGVSTLGLGITKLFIGQFPGVFRGGLVLIATPDPGDPAEHSFSLTVQGPGRSPQQFAVGTFKTADPLDQVVVAHPLEMLVAEPGAYVFRLESGAASAEARLIAASAAPEGKPKAEGGSK